ncbi:hypothetical protein RvY_03392-2 [Ramazzottius varieornatus]|uniref:Cyclin-like domain-containing protein n=1 Tax=Ramazzottius varieornatus TaxID=947166 RepID=A0A1D1UUY9_RAMVA|nr:hypothetical protein RvY_03392-2 [Ramazzottius varieornatus]
MDGGQQDDRKPTAATTKREKKWYFTSEQLRKTPSSAATANEVAGKDAWYRLQCAELVQAIGSRLRLPQIAINTAILYMHRFYQFHTMKRFHRETMAPVFVFLAAKVEETPRRLDDVIRHTYKLLNVDGPELNAESEKYSEAVQDLTTHENVLVQTLAFDLSVTHPHTHVIQCCQSLQNAIRMDEKKGLDEKSRQEKEAITKDLSHAAYALASCSLHYTLLCIQYSPVMVAAMCISVASAWTKVPLPSVSQEGKHWYEYMDASLTMAQIEAVKGDFHRSISLYPERIREKILAQVMGNGRTSSAKAPAASAVAAPGVANKVNIVARRSSRVWLADRARGGHGCGTCSGGLS